MWGIILVANQIGFLEFGTPISRVLIVIGGNAPLIVAYIVLKQQKVITGIKQFAKETFAIKQHYLHYVLLIAFLGLYFGVPAIMQGVSIGAKLYIGFLNIPLMIPLGGLEELGWRYVLQANLQKNFLLESPPQLPPVFGPYGIYLYFSLKVRQTILDYSP